MKTFDFIKENKYSDKKLLSQIIFYITKTDNIYISNYELSNDEITKIDNLYKKVALNDYPLQYITGKEIFFDNDFFVDKNVLIPRSETEYMVKKVLRDIGSSVKYGSKNTSIYDIGTGSGAIGLSVAIGLTQAAIIASIYMTDVSFDALSITKQNSVNLGYKISNDVFISIGYSDLLSEVHFDDSDIYILANLPYVDESDYIANINQLHREPKIALVAKDKGLALYFALLDDILTRKDLQGKNINIYLEINDWQYDLIHFRYADKFEFEYIIAGHDRIYIVILKNIKKLTLMS